MSERLPVLLEKGHPKVQERPIILHPEEARLLKWDRKTPDSHYELRRIPKLYDVDSGFYAVNPYGPKGDILYGRESWQLADWDWEDSGQKIRYRADNAVLERCLPDYDDIFLNGKYWADWLIEEVEKYSKLPGLKYRDRDNNLVPAAEAENREDCSFDLTGCVIPWHPAISMPRWAVRYYFDILSVHSERVQAITEEGCLAEGMRGDYFHRDKEAMGDKFQTLHEQYRDYWNQRHGKDAWDRNDIVLVFKLAKRDALPSLE